MCAISVVELAKLKEDLRAARLEIEALRARCSSMESERKASEEKLSLSNDLLSAISRAKSQFISDIDTRVLFGDLLESLLALTKSEYGFIGEVFYGHQGVPYLKTHAITNIAWNDETRAFYKAHAATGLEFRNLNSLFGAVLTSGKEVISNDPSRDSRRCGIPEGHPPLNAFLGLPFYNGEKLVGMVGIANRPGGYDEAIAEYLQPFLSTCANIIEAHRIDMHRAGAEAALRDSEHKYRSLFEDSKDAIYMTSLGGDILDMNPAGLDLLGYRSVEDLLKVNIKDLYKDPSVREKFLSDMKRFGFVRDFELTLLRPDRKELYVSISATAVNGANGEITALRGIIHDVTEHKRLQEQLLHAQKMEAVGQLTGGIAHDFNNILTGIIGYSNLILKRTGDGDSVRKFSSQILSLSDRATKLTQGLLAFSRKQIPNLAPVDVNQLVKGIERLLLRLVREDIEVQVNLSKEDLTVMADGGQIEQVLMNLVTNARDAMPRGGRLTISTEYVVFDDELLVETGVLGETGEFACLVISDTGVGMDEETRLKIFEPFFTTKDVGKGTGLGLSIVYGIVKEHKGHIRVYSEEGIGSVFKIYLPVVRASMELAASKGGETLPGGMETILLAEDDPEITIVFKTIIEEFGYRVLTASDGLEAVARFEANRDSIDLVILDVIMPRKNGKDAYDEIRKLSPGIKSIFLSGYTEDIINEKMLVEEGLEFLSKPLTTSRLLKKIREVLDNGKAGS